MDACDLADQLCGCPSLHDAIKKYDQLSMPRAQKSLRFSHIAIAGVHSTSWRNWMVQMLIRFIGLLVPRR